jgi:cytochrome c-type biogenesis protein CcmE
VAGPKRSPARLIVALAVAGVLAIFLVYTALAGGSTPTLNPSQLTVAKAGTGTVSVVGAVVGPVTGDSHSSGGLRFRVRDIGGTKATEKPVVYHGDSPPPLFAVGRHVIVSGTYANGQLAGTDIVTKCPSKYSAGAPT